MSNILRFLPFIIISGLGICLITLINTNFALVILIFSMLLSPEFPVGVVPGRPVVIRLDDILLIVVFLTWLGKSAMNKELGLLKRTSLNLPIGLYITTLTISTLLGIFTGRVHIFAGLFYLLKYVEYYILFFMVTNNIKSQRQIKVFIFFILLTSFITSIYGLHSVKYTTRATAPFESLGGGGSEPNTLGGYLILIFAITMGIALFSKNILNNLSLGMLAMLSLVTLMNTLSRGSYLGFVAMFLALTVLTTKRKIFLIILIGLCVLMGPAMLPQRVTKRITDTFIPGRVYEPLAGTRVTLDYSASARIETWRGVFERWKRSPIFGYGVTGGGLVDTQFPLVIIEGGVVGLMAFISLLINIFRNSLWTFKTTEGDYAKGLCLGFIAGFVGLLIHSFSAATFIIVRIMEPFWFLTAVVMTLPEIKD